jgi:transcriptional regulator with XRE-family HTH domain
MSMKLGAYLKDTAVTQEAFASRVNMSIASVSRISRGLQTPSLTAARAIVKATDGKVSYEDLLGGAA